MKENTNVPGEIVIRGARVHNLKNIDACITRLRLSLVDQHKINEEQLKSLGAKGIVKIGNDGLQVVLGPEAELVAEAMKQKVK